MSDSKTTKRDQFWRGPPSPVKGFAALDRDGNIMLATVRQRRTNVRLACGECVPVRVVVTFEEDDGAPDE